MGEISDQVVCFRQGEWQIFVGGRLLGAWSSKDAAEVALIVEQRRAAARNTKREAA